MIKAPFRSMWFRILPFGIRDSDGLISSIVSSVFARYYTRVPAGTKHDICLFFASPAIFSRSPKAKKEKNFWCAWNARWFFCFSFVGFLHLFCRHSAHINIATQIFHDRWGESERRSEFLCTLKTLLAPFFLPFPSHQPSSPNSFYDNRLVDAKTYMLTRFAYHCSFLFVATRYSTC